MQLSAKRSSMSVMPSLRIITIGSLLLFLLGLLVTGVNRSSFAHEIGSQDLGEQLQQTDQRIKELEQKLSEVRATASSLTSQINYMDDQIELTELKITTQQQEIDRLIKEIDLLSGKIGILDTNLNQLAELLIQRVRQTYKQKDSDYLDLFLGSENYAETNARLKYLQTVQRNDRKLLLAMQQAKSTYEQQKELKEVKQQELDQARQQLEAHRASLDQQKLGKQTLLTTTRNDEKRFQEMLAAARAEQLAIQDAIASLVKNLKDGTPVEAGTEIALMGNSGAAGGCSTAAHLHFEVTDKQGNHRNPAEFLKSGWPIEWDNDPDGAFPLTGDWDWPMNDPRVTQGYGFTWWANTGFYSGKPHTGIDMVNRDNPIIRTPKSGTLFKGAASCRGTPMNYVAVEHDDVISWYWHVQ